jgi:hypothetical protein
MGLSNPSKSSDNEFRASIRITKSLTDVIFRQEKDFSNYEEEEVVREIRAVKAEKEERMKTELEAIKEQLNDKSKRILELAQESGVGSWLNASPIQSLGYCLNKQEFRDSVCLRYGWQIPNTPSHCQCKKKNDIDHTLNCKLGGYVIMRHNKVRDLEADLMREVCQDVRIEPELLPLDTNLITNGNRAEKARLDVSGIGVWGSHERTFIDVRIMHPNSPSYINKPIEKVYKDHEDEKKRTYNGRVIQVEKGTFTPIVMSTFGGMGVEAHNFHKRIATLISEQT